MRQLGLHINEIIYFCMYKQIRFKYTLKSRAWGTGWDLQKT